MNKSFVYLAACLSIGTASAQGLSNGGMQHLMTDISSKPRGVSELNSSIDGSPYYNNSYCIANITYNGKLFPKVPAMLNLQDNFMIYKDESGQELIATSTVDRIEFPDCGNTAFESGFPAIDHQMVSTFYQVINKGPKAELLKYIQFVLRDVAITGLTNSTYTKSLDRTDVYYAYIPGKGMTRLEKNAESLLTALSDKKAAIEAYIGSHHIKGKKETDLAEVFAYYNTL